MNKRELAQKIELRNAYIAAQLYLAKHPEASASVSAGGGSKSYTHKDDEKIARMIEKLDAQIAECKRSRMCGGLGLGYPTYS